MAPGIGVSQLAMSEVFEYDALKRLNKATTNQTTSHILMGAAEFGRDGYGRVTKEKFSYFYNGVDVPTAEIDSGFGFQSGGVTVDDPGFRRSLEYSGGITVGSTPDAVGRQKSLDLSAVPPGNTVSVRRCGQRRRDKCPV